MCENWGIKIKLGYNWGIKYHYKTEQGRTEKDCLLPTAIMNKPLTIKNKLK